jgi:hypothetical protein
VLFNDEFVAEFAALAQNVQDQIRVYAGVLAEIGHELGRPWADTLKGSKFANMKELRPTVNKVEWRVAFAFDSERRAILLAAAAKGGKNSKRVYSQLISTADRRFAAHQSSLTPKSDAAKSKPKTTRKKG